MKVLVFNSGSSSVKYKLFNIETEEVFAEGFVEKIGEKDSRVKFNTKYNSIVEEYPVAGHRQGVEKIVELLLDSKVGVINDKSEVKGVGHRVVHGGEKLKSATILDEDVINMIKEMIPLAPLHNPANLKGIEVAMSVFPKAAHVGVFDTAFHQTMHPTAYRYAIPEDLYTRLHIRRYGFHGTSHHYVAKEAALYLNKPLKSLNLITAHLGNGSSITAIKNGESVDTSMGITPLEGLMMGTRCGDIDPAIHHFLATNAQMNIDAIHDILNTQSGLKGITGDNDLRAVENRLLAGGDEKAKLGMEMCSYRIKKYIGAYTAALGSVDAVIFTAGIGENSAMMRSMTCQGLEGIGIEIDEDKNKSAKRGNRIIGVDGSKVKLMVIPTNEELAIARQTVGIIKQKFD